MLGRGRVRLPKFASRMQHRKRKREGEEIDLVPNCQSGIPNEIGWNDIPVEIIEHEGNIMIGRMVCTLWRDILPSKDGAGSPLIPLDFDFAGSAAKEGFMNLVVWAKEKGCRFSLNTFRQAVQGGNLTILSWLKESGCPTHFSAVNDAIASGQLEALKWLKKECWTHPALWRSMTLPGIAARYGKVQILKWLHMEGCDLGTMGVWTCTQAAAGGHLHVLKWLRLNKCPWSSTTLNAAAEAGHFKVVKWLREQGCAWDGDTTAFAATRGHYELLMWLIEEGCSANASVCAKVAADGNLEVLKWLREQGCPWDHHTCAAAALEGHLDVLKWAREQGCPWYHYTYHNAKLHAWAFRNSEVLEYVQKNGCPRE